jgi:hypothetical protein
MFDPAYLKDNRYFSVRYPDVASNPEYTGNVN